MDQLSPIAAAPASALHFDNSLTEASHGIPDPAIMSLHLTSAVAEGCPKDLAGVMARIAADPALTAPRRREYLSALRVFSRMVGREPRLIPAAPDALSPIFKSIIPKAEGIEDARWRSIRSRTIGALKRTGVPVMPGRSTTPLSFEWATLEHALPNPRAKIGLSRFMRFCTEQDISPREVDQAVFGRFQVALQSNSVVKDPKRVYRVACDQWIKAAKTVSGWPAVQITIPKSERHYSLDWSLFPESFTRDVDAFFRRSVEPDPFADDYLPPLRPATIKLQRAQIRQMASLLVQSGRAIDTITQLSTLTEPATAKQILQAAHTRLGNRAQHLHGMSLLLNVIASHWSGASSETLKILKRFAHQAAPLKRGMTVKNRQRLRQFDSSDNLRALLDLPRETYLELGRQKELDRPAAVRALHALAIEFLIAMPIRIRNLTALDLDRHIVRTGHGRKQVLHVVIPGHETKNGEPYEAPMRPDTAALLQTYRKTYLPLICDRQSTLLFPNRFGGLRNETSFSTSLSRFIRREAGLIMNAHLFRHLTASLYLKENPEDVETARRILGHKSASTTLRFYADIKTAASFQRYDAVIGNLRTRPPAKARP